MENYEDFNRQLKTHQNALICILDYKKAENALRWYDYLKYHWKTVILNMSDKENNIDSFQRDDANIIKLDNIQFGGAVLTAYDMALAQNAEWLIYLTSDIEISDANIQRLIEILDNEIFPSDDIGVYGISGLLGSSLYGEDTIKPNYNVDMLCNYTNNVRDAVTIEDWFYVCRMDLVKESLDTFIDRSQVYYGWGLADYTTNIARNKGYRILRDDRVRIFHPYGTGYNIEGALQEGLNAKNKLINSDYLNYSGVIYFDNLFVVTLDDTEYVMPKNPEDKDKYIVCTCAKNEDEYLREWVQHYLDLGFDKIVIADNNDERRIAPILHDYIRDEKVEVLQCHGVDQMQLPFYNQFMRQGNYKWCAYYDCDEFLELNTGQNIKEFLDEQTSDVVIFNWITYGFDNIAFKKEGRIQDRFVNPLYPIMYQKENMFVKSIIKGGHAHQENSYFISAHTIKNDYGLKYSIGGYYDVDYASETHLPRYKKGYIKHYYTKSLEEWYTKVNRGWADGTSKLLPLATAYYMHNIDIPIDSYGVGPFIRNVAKLDYTGYDAYSFIKISNNSHNVYSLIYHVMAMLSQMKGQTLCFDIDEIDERLFDLFLEFAIKTGNKCITITKDTDLWALHTRISNNKETYYMIDCL